MDARERNQQVASLVFRAGLLDERSLREALERAGTGDIRALLVSSGRVRCDDLARVLGPLSPERRFENANVPAAALAEALTVLPDAPPPGARAPDSGIGAPHDTHTDSRGSSPGSSSLAGALAAKPGEAPPAGTRLGPYLLLKLLARGGMGAVFVAEHEKLGRIVALKVLLAGEAASEEQIARFQREARTTSRLSHPNVVPIYEVGADGGAHFLTMELVNGPSLRAVIKEKGSLEPRRALSLMEQVARGVAAAHAEGIVHRDLKPQNVLVAPGDVAKVMDFGLAKDAGAEEQGLTVSGAVLGTPSYMAPEQAAGEKVGPLADVYGLGATLYECLTGKPPFEGPTLASIITQVLTREPVPPRALRPSLNKDVETICLRALEKEPRKRYESARAMAEDAARWLAGEAILARPATWRERLARWTRRNLAPVLAAAAGLLVAIATVLWVLVSSELERKREREAVLSRAAAFDETLERARAGIEKLVASVTADPAPVGSSCDAAGGESAQLERAWEALDKDARALTRATSEKAPRPFIDADEASARIFLAHGGRLEAAGKERAALSAYARAYAWAPLSRPGRAGMCEIAARRSDEAASDVLDHLLRTELDPRTERRARLARARRRLERMDLANACADLVVAERDAKASGDPEVAGAVRSLLRFVRPLLEERDLDAPGPISARIVPGKPSWLEVVSLDGSVRVFRYDAMARSFALERTVPPPKLEPGERIWSREASIKAAVVVGGTPEKPLIAAFTNTHFLSVSDENGNVIGERFKRLAHVIAGLQFADLGGDPGGATVVCNMTWNNMDSLLVRVDAAHRRATPEGLDTKREGDQGVLLRVAAAPLGRTSQRERLVLGYTGRPCRLPGDAEAPLVRFVRDEGGHGHACTGSGTFEGPLWSLTTANLFSRGHLLVVAGALDDRDEAKGKPRVPGANVYAVEGDEREDRLGKPCLFHIPMTDGKPRQDFGYGTDGVFTPEIFFARAGGETWAYSRWFHHDEPYGLFRAFVLRENGSVEPVTDLPILDAASSWPILAAGDLAGDGSDAIVVAAPGGVRVLGLHGGERKAPAAPLPPISPESARDVVVDLLTRLEFTEQALEYVRRREKGTGATGRSEDVALSLLRTEEARSSKPSPGDRFAVVTREFLSAPDRSRAGRARAGALLAWHFSRSDAPSVLQEAAAELSRIEVQELPPGDAAEVQHVARLLMVRGVIPGAARFELPFTREGGEAFERNVGRLVVSDPVRIRLDPARGLVARTNRRVLGLAGVPVAVTPGAIRLVIDFSTEGQTWGGRVYLGIFRDSGATIAPSDVPREGLVLDCLFGWSGSPHYELGARFGSLETNEQKWGRYDDGVRALLLEAPQCFKARLRAVIEHDTRTHWSRWALHDRDAPEGAPPVAVRESYSQQALALGPYLAGLRLETNGNGDYAGTNFPPDATLVLERIVLAESPLAFPAPPTAPLPARGNEALLAGAAAVRLGARLTAGDASLEKVVQAYDAALARAEGESIPRLLVQRADARARAGDVPGARADLARALDGAPLAFFWALEDDGRFLDDGTARVLRELLRDELATTAARLAKEPDSIALLERRAVIERLRGDSAEAFRTLRHADELAERSGAGPDLARAYLHVSLTQGTPEERDALAKFWKERWTTPEFVYFLRTYWQPEGPLTEAELASRVQGTSDAWARETWLSRWIELFPSSAEPFRARATWVQSGKHPDAQMQWRIAEDLKRAVELDPKDASSRALLGIYEAIRGEPAAATEHLKAARLLGVSPESVLRFSANVEKDNPKAFAVIQAALR